MSRKKRKRGAYDNMVRRAKIIAAELRKRGFTAPRSVRAKEPADGNA